jgi:threonine aldolase
VTTIDLRSDTVTQPTAGMRAAMAAAPVGDDCYGDDPTVNALEARVAGLLGKEAGVFLASGTMANQIAVHVHARPGDALAAPAGAHVQIHEDGSAAGLSGVQIMPLGTRGGYDAQDLEDLLAEEATGWPPVGVVWVENTLGLAGGRVWPLPAVERVAAVARAHGRPIHLDGARLWNASAASGVGLASWGACADSVTVALSKGLGAPMGSVLCGTEHFVARVRRFKHGFGGGLRQAGLVAAAGVYALDHHVARLQEDHENARRLAGELARLSHWTVETPETNLVLARCVTGAAAPVCDRLREVGVLCIPNTHREVRFALHLGIDAAGVVEAIARIRRALA